MANQLIERQQQVCNRELIGIVPTVVMKLVQTAFYLNPVAGSGSSGYESESQAPVKRPACRVKNDPRLLVNQSPERQAFVSQHRIDTYRNIQYFDSIEHGTVNPPPQCNVRLLPVWGRFVR